MWPVVAVAVVVADSKSFSCADASLRDTHLPIAALSPWTTHPPYALDDEEKEGEEPLNDVKLDSLPPPLLPAQWYRTIDIDFVKQEHFRKLNLCAKRGMSKASDCCER